MVLGLAPQSPLRVSSRADVAGLHGHGPVEDRFHAEFLGPKNHLPGRRVDAGGLGIGDRRFFVRLVFGVFCHLNILLCCECQPSKKRI
jgi:hypothetical protein